MSMLLLIRHTLVILLLTAQFAFSAQSADLIYPGASWKKTAPLAAGWSPDALRKADEIAASIRTDSYMVIHKGAVVHEFGTTAKPGNLYSVRKSVLSILIGIYVDKGAVHIEKRLSDLGINDKDALTDVEKLATIRELLQARSGIYHPSAYEPPEITASHPARGTYRPGEHFEYNNWDFNVLGTAFHKFTGKSVFDSLRDDLAVPLQFEDFTARRDTRWVYERRLSEHPAYIMHLSARDLGRVGLLMARGGQWKEKRIVSEAWVRESTASYSQAGSKIGYGYLWWVGIDGWHFGQKFPGRVFSARGNYGQYLLVDPVNDLVIVHKTGNRARKGHGKTGSRDFGVLLAHIVAAGPDLKISR